MKRPHEHRPHEWQREPAQLGGKTCAHCGAWTSDDRDESAADCAARFSADEWRAVQEWRRAELFRIVFPSLKGI